MGRCHPLVQRPADLWSSNLHSSGLRSLVGHNFSGTHFPLVWVRCSVAPRTEQSARTPKEKKSFSGREREKLLPPPPKKSHMFKVTRISQNSRFTWKSGVCGRGPLFNCILPLEYFVVTVTSGYIPPRKMPIMDPQQRVEWTQNSNPHCVDGGLDYSFRMPKTPKRGRKKLFLKRFFEN